MSLAFPLVYLLLAATPSLSFASNSPTPPSSYRSALGRSAAVRNRVFLPRAGASPPRSASVSLRSVPPPASEDEGDAVAENPDASLPAALPLLGVAAAAAAAASPLASLVRATDPTAFSLGSIAGLNVLGLFVSLVSKTHYHLDLLGTGAFAVAAAPEILPILLGDGGSLPATRAISGAAMGLWGAKLASFLFYRVLRRGHDARLDGTLSTAAGAASFWTVSLLWGVLTCLPHLLGRGEAGEVTSWTIAGSVVYAVGLAVETVADVQKMSFKKNHPGGFCNVGLWSKSQHPNYFGNFMLWCGITIMNVPALAASPWRLGLALLSPLSLLALFSAQAEGSMTNAVDLAAGRFGKDPEYQKYLENVPLIFPKLFGR